MISTTSSTSILKIATLNCRGLAKAVSDPVKFSLFLRYLRLSGSDILVLQETHAHSLLIQQSLDIQFQAKSSVWSRHCGIVSLNPHYVITPDSHISPDDGRFIFATITTANVPSPLAYILNIYAPAQYGPRKTFFRNLALNTFITNLLSNTNTPTFILGDFNFNTHKKFTSDLGPWVDFLLSYFVDCFQDDKLPTYISTTGSRSTIDYVFCSTAFSDYVKGCDQEFINYNWTDHALLSIRYQLQSTSHGRGAWKANPFLAGIASFRTGLENHIQTVIDSQPLLHPADNHDIQFIWDNLKEETKIFARSFQLKRNSCRQKDIKKLQSKRNRILRDYKNTAILSMLLPQVEALLSTLEEEHAQIEALKAGKIWREKGEKSAGFLKRIASSRSTHRAIPDLFNPTTNALTTSHAEKSEVIVDFYRELYSPTSINTTATNSLLGIATNRDRDRILSFEQKEALLVPFVLDEIIEAGQRSPAKSSPGSDGLPYEILILLLTHPATGTIVLEMYNSALRDALFPASWYQSLMTLIPKKGDLSQISNHRPIQLVNTDSKIFTRLVNSRIMDVASQIINPYQLGFMPGKYIAENGLLAQIIIENATQFFEEGHLDLGLLLDQQKAYDMVNLEYLSTVLLHYGFPEVLVHSLYKLFQRNRIVINVNGFLCDTSVPKLRGLKQGDPISCILYNFALEPLLRSILDDDQFSGYSFKRSITVASPPNLPAIKLLSYADDTLLFIKDAQDLRRMEFHLHNYSLASNAKINFHKIRALSLSGRTLNHYWLPLLLSFDIQKIWNQEDTDPIIYLGYPLLQSIAQRTTFCKTFLLQLRQSIELHNRRGISLLGRATIANSLILSKCWYILSVVPVPLSFIKEIRSVVCNFVTSSIFPRISWSLMITPRENGGLGILDPVLQQKALYYRWVDPILFPRDEPKSIVAFVAAHFLNYYRMSNLPLALLFPSARPTIVSTATVGSMIARSMDSVPRDFSDITASPIDCLLFPIKSIIDYPVAYKLSPKLRGRIVSDLFEYHPVGHFLRPKAFNDIPYDTRFVARKFFKALSDGNCRYHTFFQRCLVPTSLNLLDHPDADFFRSQLEFLPFKKGLQINAFDPDSLTCNSPAKLFRTTIKAHSTVHFHQSQAISTGSWSTFWRFSLLFTQRNVVYRFIHDKIPTRLLLYRLFPSQFPSGNCLLCSIPESKTHFFFDCPLKATFWNRLIREFLWPGTTISIISSCINRLTFTCLSILPACPAKADVLIIIALSEIWKAHWRTVFDNKPFSAEAVLSNTILSLQRRKAEDNVHRA